MTAYNQTRFKSDTFIYNRTDPEIIKRGNFFRALDGRAAFDDGANPCVKCGKCERVCTQRLRITDTLSEVYKWVNECCVSDAARGERLSSLIRPGYERVGFYTAGLYTASVLGLYKRLAGDFSFEVYVFDSNPLRWGQEYFEGIIISGPDAIPDINLDILIISNYVHSDEIYSQLSARFPDVNIQKLHSDSDVPWAF
jgi:ferredoxin